MKNLVYMKKKSQSQLLYEPFSRVLLIVSKVVLASYVGGKRKSKCFIPLKSQVKKIASVLRIFKNVFCLFTFRILFLKHLSCDKHVVGD